MTDVQKAARALGNAVGHNCSREEMAERVSYVLEAVARYALAELRVTEISIATADGWGLSVGVSNVVPLPSRLPWED